MAKAPEDRPATAQELADEIRAALADVPAASTATTRRGAGAAAAGAGAAAAGAAGPGAAAAGAAAAGAGTRRREPIVARPPTAARAPDAQVEAPDRRASRRFPILVAALLAVGILSALAVAALGGGDDQAATDQAESSAPSEPAEEPQDPEPEPDPAPAEPETETEPQGSDLSGADPVALNNQGYDLYLAGSYDEAVPLLRRSVAAFEAQGRTGEKAYAFALYNLGSSLNRSGRPQEAIPLLERRLEVDPDEQPDEVEAELADARAKANSASAQGGDASARGNGSSARGGDASARGARGGKDKDDD
jgi:tetratricopeptide (TPR) repeat protein